MHCIPNKYITKQPKRESILLLCLPCVGSAQFPLFPELVSLFHLIIHHHMADEDALVQQLLLRLSQTRYACSSLVKLSGGTTNFLYRGMLLQPLDSQDSSQTAIAKTVVVKHSKDFVPGNIDFSLDITRCVSMHLISAPQPRPVQSSLHPAKV